MKVDERLVVHSHTLHYLYLMQGSYYYDDSDAERNYHFQHAIHLKLF
jgi:hypothetical protein